MNQPQRYGVIGHPVKHSVSPLIHRHFAEQTGENISYELIEAPLDGFADSAHNFLAAGGKGLNITLPFKQEAFEMADTFGESAHRAKAVNTLVFKDGVIAGHNTDGIGLVKDIRDNCALTLGDQRILIVGAGGAARGIIPSLFDAGVDAITIANRSLPRARNLRDDLSSLGDITTCALDAFDTTPDDAFNGIINATSASLKGEMPADFCALSPNWAYDLVYAAQPTPFIAWFADQGIRRVFDGFGMLIEQAAESFYLWRGVRPETATALRVLRAKICT